MEKGSLINYRQGKGKRICLVASFASFLHSVGCQHHAFQLFSAKDFIQENDNVWNHFRCKLLSLSPFLHLEKFKVPPEGIPTMVMTKFQLLHVLLIAMGSQIIVLQSTTIGFMMAISVMGFLTQKMHLIYVVQVMRRNNHFFVSQILTLYLSSISI